VLSAYCTTGEQSSQHGYATAYFHTTVKAIGMLVVRCKGRWVYQNFVKSARWNSSPTVTEDPSYFYDTHRFKLRAVRGYYYITRDCTNTQVVEVISHSVIRKRWVKNVRLSFCRNEATIASDGATLTALQVCAVCSRH